MEGVTSLVRDKREGGREEREGGREVIGRCMGTGKEEKKKDRDSSINLFYYRAALFLLIIKHTIY